MSPVRRILLLAFALSVSVLGATAAAAGGSAGPPPATGQWKTTDTPGGFTIVGGKGKKLYVKNLHFHTGGLGDCGLEKAATFTALGSFPLKPIPVYEARYEKVWGVGKYGDQDIEGENSGIASVPARIKVAGKVMKGAVKLDFAYDDPGELLFAGMFFGPKETPCLAYAQEAEHSGG